MIEKDACRLATFGVLGYFAYQKSRLHHLAFTAAGIGYSALKGTKPAHDHHGCGGAISLLSGVEQPAFLEFALGIATFILHAEHSLMHKVNVFQWAGFYAFGCYSVSLLGRANAR